MRLIFSEKEYKNIRINTVLVVAVVAFTLFAGGYAGVALTLDKDVFSEGVSVGGINVSGVGWDQAKKSVLTNEQQELSKIQLPVVIHNDTIQLNADDLGISTDANDVLNQAFDFNKSSGDSLAERFNKSVQKAQDKSYKVNLIVDENKITEKLTEIAQKYDIKPVDAQATFDKKTKDFQYTQSKNGEEINIPEAVKKIEERVKNSDYSELDIQSESVAPKLSVDALKSNTSMIGVCETKTTNEEDRNKNIQLVCEDVDGQVIEPGQILSINDIVGERTVDKGFRMAPAIIDGTLTDQVGGGICQVAGTLYNAALLADMKIVERVHHTWPSSYLPVGLDATLNYDDKDLKLQNTTDYAIYVSAKFDNQTVRIELYGEPQPDNIAVTIDNEIVQKEDPPASDIIYTNSLPPGAQQTQTSPREGYEVNVYRLFSQNGTVIKKEMISQDNYLATKGVIFVGTAAQQK